MVPDLVELSFKQNRKAFAYNSDCIELRIGDYVLIEVEKGQDLGKISQVGRLVMLKDMKREPTRILRKATEADLERLEENRRKESMAFQIGKEFILRHDLNMKLVDVEYQFDNNKLTFYFTSDQRVDFRQLVKDLATKYRTRIELRQIGVREEARRLGGCGVCGQALCCTTFMNNFSPISTQDAKQQNLPMNPSKLSGLCGRLKCCLLFEKGFYSSSMKRFPPLDSQIQTNRGTGHVDKIDIFNDYVLLRFEDDEYEKFSLDEINRWLSGKTVTAPESV